MFEQVVEVLRSELSRLDDATVTPAQVLDQVTGLETVLRAAAAAQWWAVDAFTTTRTVQDRDVFGLGPEMAGRSVPAELGLGLGVATVTARCKIADAQAAVADHPRLLGLVEAGVVSPGGLAMVIRETGVLPGELRRLVDAQLADEQQAHHHTPGRLAAAARRRVDEADPAAALHRAVKARAERRICLLDPADGTAVIWVKLKAEEAAGVYHRLETHARLMRAAGDPRPLAGLMCDLLVAAVCGTPVPPPPGPGEPDTAGPDTANAWLGVGAWPEWFDEPDPHAEAACDPDPWDTTVPEPFDQTDAETEPPRQQPVGVAPGYRSPFGPRGARVEVQVVIAATTLLGLDNQPGMLRGYGTIPAGIVRQIADDNDPVLRRLICDPIDGRLIGIDTHTRCYTGPLRQFILARDQVCRLTGNTIADLDHITEHAAGGPTTATNGHGLSKTTHTLRDHPAIHLTTSPPGQDSQDRPGKQPDDGPPDDAAGDDDHDGGAQQLLDRMRADAPDIDWQMPTGHTYQTRPPPALGWGSQPSDHRAEPPPLTSAAELHLRLILTTEWLRRRLNKPRDDPPDTS